MNYWLLKYFYRINVKLLPQSIVLLQIDYIMKNRMLFLFIINLKLFLSCSSDINTDEKILIPKTNETYFPTLNSDTWETKSLEELGWNIENEQLLLNFLEENNTKGFIVLHEGKIVLEKYFNNHSASTPWYWASAGKTLTATIAGIAQDEGLININNKVSDYIGTAWTSIPIAKENLITCKNLLSMNSGLDDSMGDAVSPDNLTYTADAGTRWAYHNVYVKIQDVIATASNKSWSNYFNLKLRDKIGMSGSWLASNNDLNVYWSTTRSMARFGLFIYANGKWENKQIISESFLNEATNTSQDINLSYGYLWWLNGKSSYGLPQTQIKLNGSLVPNAPSDMYAALGKNDQKIYIISSKELVIVRMGNAAVDSKFALSSFDNALWKKINALIN